MDKDNRQTAERRELHRRAKAQMERQFPAQAPRMSQADALTLVTELRIHQIELELQNEELQEARAALEAEKARYAELYEFAPVGYLSLDRQGAINRVNLSGALLLGGERSRLIGRPLEAFVSSPDLPVLWDCLAAAFTGEGQASCELKLGTGGKAAAHVRLEGGLTPDGQACLLAMSDITERKVLEEAQDFLIRCGWTPGGPDFFHELAQFLAQALNMDFARVDRLEGGGLTARTLAAYGDVRAGGSIPYAVKDTPCAEAAGQAVCCFPEGVRQLFPKDAALQGLEAESYAGATLWGADKTAIGLIAVIGRKPLADPRLAESLLRLVGIRAAGEMERRQAEDALRAAREKAEAASEAKSTFLANMSHEIRTPLNGMLGMLQFVQTRTLDEETAEHVSLAVQSGGRLNRLLSDILDLSRVEAGMLVIQPAPLSLRDVMKAVEQMFLPVAKRTGVRLSSHVDQGIPETLLGDAARLQQVLVNLAGNAFKFTKAGQVGLDAYPLPATRPGEYRALFAVSDTGKGISDEDLGRLFMPFTQVEADYSRKHQGAGLGLAICKRLVKLMGGTMAVDSDVGIGATVYFCVTFGTVAPGQAAIQPRDEAETAALRKSYRILVVEDDLASQIVARKMLENAGHQWVCAGDGRQALEALRQETFDAVLMDIQLPVMNGLEAAQAIRRGEAGQDKANIPIVALTAYAMTGDRERLLAAGMDEYVAKPVQFSDIQGALKRVLEKA